MRNRIIGFPSLAGMALAAIAASSCGSTDPTSPSTETVHTFPQTIMIMEAHPVPEELTIAVGERVSFMNHDRTSYTVAGGREPARRDCPEIDVVGVLNPGDTRTSEPFTTAKTCDFHVGRDQSALLAGRIIIR
jgi:plastocyanin